MESLSPPVPRGPSGPISLPRGSRSPQVPGLQLPGVQPGGPRCPPSRSGRTPSCRSRRRRPARGRRGPANVSSAESTVVATSETTHSIPIASATRRHTAAADVSPTAASRLPVPRVTASTIGSRTAAARPRVRPRTSGVGFMRGWACQGKGRGEEGARPHRTGGRDFPFGPQAESSSPVRGGLKRTRGCERWPDSAGFLARTTLVFRQKCRLPG